MTARDRVVRLQRVLGAVVLARALLAAASAALVVIAVGRAFASSGVGTGAVAAAAGIGAFVWLTIPVVAARSPARVALWVEERHPSLGYALVSAVERAGADGLERAALRVPWWEVERRRLLRALFVPLLAFVAALIVAALLPSLARLAPHVAAVRGGSHAADPLRTLRATVRAPSYAGGRVSQIHDPASIDALAGSTITIDGDGGAAAVSAKSDSTPRRVAPSSGGGWTVTVPMPAHPGVLRLRSTGERARDRLVALAPIVDAPPVVTLLLPARDTVVRAATGVLPLRAQLRDDIGLRDAAFELIVSSGQDESFTFRTATLGRVAFGGRSADTPDAVLTARVKLDSLALKPGDVLQVRAVARDGNTVGGPGFGTSETRAFRVARAGEYDSVSVDAAPPPDPEAQALSQRMLIMLTEALDKHRSRLDRGTLLDESHRIAGDQARLRKQVGDVVFQRIGADPLSEESNLEERGKLTPGELLKRASEATGGNAGAALDVEGDETPILAVNRPLLEAFNAMWEAGRALDQGDTRRALPPMRVALAAIARARQAERIYLRGRPSTIVVDVGRARLAGKDKGASSIREPRAPADPIARRRADSFARVTALLATDPSAAADSLLVMRIGALGDAPGLAAVLDTAARVVRRGDARAIPLVWARVRRALGGSPVRSDGLPLWGGAP